MTKEDMHYSNTDFTYIKKICESAAERCMMHNKLYHLDTTSRHMPNGAHNARNVEEEKQELVFPELMFFDKKMKDVDVVKSWEDFVIGKKYYIWARRIKSKNRKTYILKHVISTLNNDCLNICVMKQCSGPSSVKFTLTESDCENIGIDFEYGLEIYPVNIGWVKQKDDKNKNKKYSETKGQTIQNDVNLDCENCWYSQITIK